MRLQEARALLPALIARLPESYLKSRRWFSAKTWRIRAVELFDSAVLSAEMNAFLTIVRVESDAGQQALYQLPVALRSLGIGEVVPPIAAVSSDGAMLGLYDALDDEAFRLLLAKLLSSGASMPTGLGGSLSFEPTDLFRGNIPASSVLSSAEQSNTSIIYGAEWILKAFRQVVFGENRDVEVSRFLMLETSFRQTPMLGGSVEYRMEDGREATLAALYRFVPNQGDCWNHVIASLRHFPLELSMGGPPGSDLIDDMRELGRTTAELHLALGSRVDIPSFAPEPASAADLATWKEELREDIGAALAALQRLSPVGPDVAGHPLVTQQEACIAAIERFTDRIRPCAWKKIQVHGDYHLGQVLKTTSGFTVIDFEGEPLRPLEKRRAKQSALRDVAGVLRSLSYAAHAAAPQESSESYRNALLAWEKQASLAFLRSWMGAVQGSHLLPVQDSDTKDLLTLFLLTKAFYELTYELNNRPDWVSIPLFGIERIAGSL